MTLIEHRTTVPAPTATELTMAGALNAALRDAMADDPNV
jgi:hypothetical protein